jgi:hypothetical protein
MLKSATKKKGSSMPAKKTEQSEEQQEVLQQTPQTEVQAQDQTQPDPAGPAPSTFPHSAIYGDEGSAAQGQVLEDGAQIETSVNPNTDPRKDVAADHPAGWPVLQAEEKK